MYYPLRPGELPQLEGGTGTGFGVRMLEVESLQKHTPGTELLGYADRPVSIGETPEVEHRVLGHRLRGKDDRTLEQSRVHPDEVLVVAMGMDEFLDQINTSAKSILLYMPDRIDQPLIDLAQYIDAEADAMVNIIRLMSDMKANFSAISMQCDRITELEHAGDDSYEEYIGSIFRDEKNAIELMKYKNLAEVFEATTDRAKKFSDHVRKILLRYVQ